MSTVQAKPLSKTWKDRLDLSMRYVPELYEDPKVVEQSPHASAIRTTLGDLGASAVFCVQSVPTVVIVVLDEYDRERVIDLHGALWNQGLATLLLVLCGDTIRAFSLTRTPYIDDEGFDDRHLVQELDAVVDGLIVKNLIYGAESGRLWEHHADYFKTSERIDRVLLDNLSASHEALCREGLSTDAAQALLIQAMFIAYLEDRDIVRPEYFRSASDGSSATFLEILQSGNSNALYRLFGSLREHFNGDLFVAPCSFDPKGQRPRVVRIHLQTLARFRSGQEEMGHGRGQLRFWGYNFRYIPIELVSAVYDHFLGAREAERRNRGAYYTPMFLADTVISSVWDELPERTRAKGVVLDPACGSGVFLVRSFQLLCEQWRQMHKSQTIRWDSLLTILSRLHGWDVNAGAVRVAVFSLYVALLQEVRPPEIRVLAERGRVLPELWGRTLRAQDFFRIPEDALRADVIVGNPPWSSRRGADRSSVSWCDEHQLPMPGREDAWAFVWKSLRHLREDGVVGFLLPAMGFLHNHASNAVNARHRLMRDARIRRIVNFSDMRFQLFEGAVRPAALLVFGRAGADAPGYRFDYWTPKADLNLKIRRAITLSSVDRRTITSRHAEDDASIFKRRLWMNDPESKLFGYLAALPRLGDLVSEYRAVYRLKESVEARWVVGHGFKPAKRHRIGEDDYQHQESETVATTPHLPIQAFRALSQNYEYFRPFENGRVHRKGFERGFDGPRVLVPRGISTSAGRLRAAYIEEPLTFEHIILSISVPDRDANRAKLLTALLNSKLLFWFAFHGTASFGSDRPEIQQAELLRLPFPAAHGIQQDGGSEKAAGALLSLIDDAIASARQSFSLRPSDNAMFDQLDAHCYRYFGLGEEEIALVEDAVEHLIPYAQPHTGASLDLWQPSDRTDRQTYANTLVHSMTPWLDDDSGIDVVLEARNDDLALLHLRLTQRSSEPPYRERDDRTIGEALRRLGEHIEVPLPGNFQLVPDFRLFVGKSLYLVKPLQRRFWLRSAAIADADAISMELHDAVRLRETGDPT